MITYVRSAGNRATEAVSGPNASSLPRSTLHSGQAPGGSVKVTLVPGEQHSEAAGDSDWSQGSNKEGGGATGQRMRQRAPPGAGAAGSVETRAVATGWAADRPRALCRPWACTFALSYKHPAEACDGIFLPLDKEIKFFKKKNG